MIQALDSVTSQVANKSLDALWMRSNAISDNIANIDTSGYKSKTVSFEDSLSGALADNNLTESETASLAPTQVEQSGNIDQNGNGVDLESEMIELTRNQLQYSYMTKAVTGSYNLLSLATNEGRG
jgi:flagellar basal-body rod protein FlgB